MPELPEVETIVAGLRPKLTGLVIQDIRVFLPSLVRKDRNFRLQRIQGKRIDSVRRRGKMILVECQDRLYLIFHLKMTGRLFWTPRQTPLDKHTHLVVSFRGRADEIRFRDVRKFGYLRCLEASDPLECPELHGLGPEPLDLDLESFSRLFQGRKGRLKSLLLNQTFLAGIGNIYADESLWRAKIHPKRIASRIAPKDLQTLIEAAGEVMTEALAAGGTSFDDLYVNVNGESGYFERGLAVYGRRGEPCPRCATPIRREAFMNRSSHFCPTCQRPPRTG